VFFISCQSEPKKETFIKSSEIGIYYDAYLKKTVILETGKHNIPNGIWLNIYPIVDTLIKRNVQVLTKDGKPVTYRIDFWYSVNSKTIKEFNMEIGNTYIDIFVLPKVYSEIRKSFSKYDSLDIKIPEIEKEIETELNNDVNFAKFIKTKSFKFGKKD
jgi:hypothetical protein